MTGIPDDIKYDRQLRLWGGHGQKCLAHAHICLLGANGLGSETVKNLVLPGIGQFTVVDGAHVEEKDLGESFFVHAEDVGTSRAVAMCKGLQELNADVQGHAIQQDVSDVLALAGDALSSFFDGFTAVIVANPPGEDAALLPLAALLETQRKPLILVRSIGFLAVLRICAGQHTVIETKLDNAARDLRITAPFDTLKAHAMAKEWDAMTAPEHSHVPWICILVAEVEKWRSAHNGALPSVGEEKRAFKKHVLALARGPQEENFPEAHEQAHLGYTAYRMPNEAHNVLQHDFAQVESAKATPIIAGEAAYAPGTFWRIVAGIAAFVANEGQGMLPLAGDVPDLTATTDGYLALQNVYANKAKADADVVMAHVVRLFGAADAALVGLENVQFVCRHVGGLQHLTYRPLADELAGGVDNIKGMLNDATSDAHWYVAFRAAQIAEEQTVDALEAAARSIVGDTVATPGRDRFLHLLRAGDAQLHNTAAVLGGIASQELIKVITHQYVPVNNTFVWNGIKGTSVAFAI